MVQIFQHSGKSAGIDVALPVAPVLKFAHRPVEVTALMPVHAIPRCGRTEILQSAIENRRVLLVAITISGIVTVPAAICVAVAVVAIVAGVAALVAISGTIVVA